MITRRPRVDDVCVRVFPGTNSPDQENMPVRAYEVAVYGSLPLGVQPSVPLRAVPEMGDLPLLTSGNLKLKWARYQDILAQFFEGEKGLEAMQFRIRDWLSPELQIFVDQVLIYPSPVSIWWSVEAPELEDIPWEVLFYAKPNVIPSTGFNFIRGVPPEVPTPVLPLTGPLRVMWTDTPFTPPWMRTMFQSSIAGLDFMPSSDHIRQTLRKAAARGIEIVHLCSDGTMTLAYEGVLKCNEPDERPLSAAELSDIVSGSRVSIIALTASPLTVPAQTDSPVQVYRAFSAFASSKTRLPSILAPVGPADNIAPLFWQMFYSNFGSGHRLDSSFATARMSARGSTFALFLRHSRGRIFRPVAQAAAVPSPARMATELQDSLEFSERLKAINVKYGDLPDYLSSFATSESQRRSDIESQLSEWTATEAEE